MTEPVSADPEVGASARAGSADAAGGPGGRRRGRVRTLLVAALELFALTGLAVAQPLLDVFGRAPEQFAFRGVEGRTIVAFGLALTFAVPLALVAVEAVVGLVSERARSGLHLVLLAGLAAAWVLQVALSLAGGPLRVLLALAVGGGLAVAHVRLAPVRTWLSYLSPAPILFLALFLVASPVSGLISGDEVVARSSRIGSPAPVVLIVFDELPLTSLVDADGAIDADLFPNFAALAERSSWFRNTTSVSSSTGYAVPAIVTGQAIEDGLSPIASDHPDSIFTLLGGAYDLDVTESITRICPTNLCDAPPVDTGGGRQLLHDAADVLRARLSWSGPQDDAVAGFEEPAAEPEVTSAEEIEFGDFDLNQPGRVSAFLDGIGSSGPDLHYLHVLLPHVPYRFLPSGARYDSPDPDLGRIDDDWTDQAWPVDQGRQRHLLQLGYVDTLLGEAIARLKATGTYDDSLVVVTADHGISFRPGQPIRGLSGQALEPEVLADLAWVPLFVKEPGQTDGVVSDANTTTLDVLPTIADVLDVEVPWELAGRSVLGPPRTTAAKSFRPSRTNGFGVEALDPVRVDEVTGLEQVFRQGVDALLPPGAGDERWWSLGPAPDLVGTSVDEAADGLRRVDVSFVDGTSFDVDAASGTVPALVRGRGPELAVGDHVAVAIDGVIGATAVVYDDGGPVFSAVVGDERFRSGTNDVVVYELP